MSSPAAVSPGVLGFRVRRDALEPQLWSTAYIGAVILIGGVLFAWRAPHFYAQPRLAMLLLAAGLVLSLFKLRLPLKSGNATMSMAYVADFITLLTLGPNVAMVNAACSCLLQCTMRVRRSQPVHRTLFSVATIIIGGIL